MTKLSRLANCGAINDHPTVLIPEIYIHRTENGTDGTKQYRERLY